MGNPREKHAVALGSSLHLVLPPPPLGHHQMVDENSDKRGGKGMLPACCHPLWRREGVTLIAAAENKRITKKKRISTKPKTGKKNLCRFIGYGEDAVFVTL